jgi:hypothetical protein
MCLQKISATSTFQLSLLHVEAISNASEKYSHMPCPTLPPPTYINQQTPPPLTPSSYQSCVIQRKRKDSAGISIGNFFF